MENLGGYDSERIHESESIHILRFTCLLFLTGVNYASLTGNKRIS